MLDRPVAFQRSFVRIGTGITGALMLSQLVYWTMRTADGWIYKTQDEWEDETGLTRYEQEGARKKLRSLGVLLEQKKGVPAKLFYKIDIPVLYQLLGVTSKDAEIPHTRMGKTSKPDAGNSTFFHTETTTDIPPNPQEGEEADPSQNKNGKTRIEYQAVADAFNDILGDRLPQVQQLNEKRKRGIKRIISELNEPTLNAVRAYFTTFSDTASPFYFGDNTRGWRAGFDYLLRSDVLVKTREGGL